MEWYENVMTLGESFEAEKEMTTQVLSTTNFPFPQPEAIAEGVSGCTRLKPSHPQALKEELV
jgi:hypothetical protein